MKIIVDRDYFEVIKEDLPRVQENTRPKMIAKEELKKLFKVFDKELERKRKLPEFEPGKSSTGLSPSSLYTFMADCVSTRSQSLLKFRNPV